MTVTSTGEGGTCSLRAAIEAVNTHNGATGCGPLAASGATPIHLAANTYTPFDGQIPVSYTHLTLPTIYSV